MPYGPCTVISPENDFTPLTVTTSGKSPFGAFGGMVTSTW